MGRPRRLNADYFSHDTGMRNDPKIKAIRNKFGLEGYAVWCMILEVLTGSDHFEREIDDLEIELLSADFGISPDLFSEILAYLLRLKLLSVNDDKKYLSQKLTERLQPVVDKRRNSQRKGVSVPVSTQSKVKESKVKETNIKTNTKKSDDAKIFLEENFELFWSIYPKRKGKKVGKQNAKKNFLKMKVADVDRIITNAKNYGVGNDYVKDPERFLMNDFWKDWDSPQVDDVRCHENRMVSPAGSFGAPTPLDDMPF